MVRVCGRCQTGDLNRLFGLWLGESRMSPRNSGRPTGLLLPRCRQRDRRRPAEGLNVCEQVVVSDYWTDFIYCTAGTLEHGEF